MSLNTKLVVLLDVADADHIYRDRWIDVIDGRSIYRIYRVGSAVPHRLWWGSGVSGSWAARMGLAEFQFVTIKGKIY